MRKRRLMVLFCTIFANVWGQDPPFDPGKWEIEPEKGRIVDYLGRRALQLQGGHAIVRDSNFTDGVIEFDIAFSGERGFMGAIWRLVEGDNYEEFYMRPHQSGQVDANQYTPSFNGMTGWQLYHGEGYGAPVAYHFNRWMPVKIVVSGNSAEIYIKDLEKPVLFVPELKHETRSGKVGLSAGNFAPAYFSNFRFYTSSPILRSQAPPVAAASEKNIMQWRVSQTFDEKSLDGVTRLTSPWTDNQTWTPLACESRGLANLSRLNPVTPKANTVFARITLVSDRERVVRFQFGYSDRVKAFLNDRLIYGGDNGYRSRDYRYLGTIGFFDELYLPLEKGKNELWLAVSESFGGWGLQGRLADDEGVRIDD